MSGILMRVMLVMLAWDYVTADDGQSVAERFYDATMSSPIVQTILEEILVSVDVRFDDDI
jgi:hypothetical protein